MKQGFDYDSLIMTHDFLIKNKVIETENPNGYDPIFNNTIVKDGGILEEYNVTYFDLINKPIQVKIVAQGQGHPFVCLFIVKV